MSETAIEQRKRSAIEELVSRLRLGGPNASEVSDQAADIIDSQQREIEALKAKEWSPMMKGAAMADAQKVCDQHAEITRLTSERDALKAIVSDLVKAAEPFVNFIKSGYGAYNPDSFLVELEIGNLRALSEAVARAGKDTP
jgi:hypothetical protein